MLSLLLKSSRNCLHATGFQLLKRCMTRPLKNGIYRTMYNNRVGASSTLEQHYLRKDGIEKGYELIYRSPMGKYVTVTHGLSVMIAIAGFVGYGVLYFHEGNEKVVEQYMSIDSTTEFFVYLGAFVLFNIGIWAVTMRCPLRIYASKDNLYIAVFMRFIPPLLNKKKFMPSDIRYLNPSGILPWNPSLYKIHNRRVLILNTNFRRPSDLYKMLGRDK